jgi:AraC-like DNA-binding protein
MSRGIRTFFAKPPSLRLPLHWHGIGEAFRRDSNCIWRGNEASTEPRLVWHVTLDGAARVYFGSNESVSIPKGMCFLVRRPGNYTYSVDSEVGHWKYVWGSFSGFLVDNFWKAFHAEPAWILRIPLTSPEVALLRRLVRTYRTSAPDPWENTQYSLRLITLLLRRAQGVTVEVPIQSTVRLKTRKIDNLLKPILHDPGLSISKSGWADGLKMSRFQLRRAVQHSLGGTPKEILNQHRLTLACRYLRQRTLSIPEVARKTGIPDSSYFARFFRKMTGLSPMAWRRQFGYASPITSPDHRVGSRNRFSK